MRRVGAKVGALLARAARRLGGESKVERAALAGTHQQARLEEAQRIAGIGSYECDVPVDRITWSDELFRIYGYEPRSFEPDYERYMATVHPEDRERVHAIVQRAVQDHQPFDYEVRIVRPDGAERVCHARGNVFTDSAGAPVRLAGTVQDITQRKSNEAALARQRDQLEEAQRIARIGSWEWDIPADRATWSDEFFRIVGHEPGAFEPDFERYMAMVHPEDRERVQAILGRALEDHQPFSYEFRLVCPDGAERLFHSRGNVFTDPAGAPVRMAGTGQDVTERRALEEELAHHRDQLEEAQRIATMGSWEWDIPADRITLSDELFRMAGLEPQSFVPDIQRFFDTVHPDDRGMVQEMMRQAMEDAQPYSYDYRILRPDGAIRYCHARSTPYTDASGAVVRMAGTNQDITERKAIEDKLARQRDQLDEAQRIARVGSWEWDIPVDRATWSDEFFRMVGYEPGSFEPDFERYMATVHPDDRERAQAILGRALEDHQPFSYEFRVVRPDGAERVFHSRGLVFTDHAGAPVRIAGTSQDITEKKALEAQLVHRDQLEEAQRIALIGSWDWDLPSGRITWSDELFRMLGYEPGSFEPDFERYMATVHPEDRERVRATVGRALEDHQPINYECRVVRPDGEKRFCHTRGNVFTDHTGAAVRAAGTNQDITERKAMEDDLVRARDEATAARVAAEEASVAKGTFLANMSHELRTPLNSVIGFANVLLKNKSGNLEATDLQYLERIQANGEHLLELINDVLDLSKVEAGKMEAEVERVSLSELVEETIAGLRGAVRDDTIDLRAIVPDSMAPIATDRGKLKQILINLVANAIKFTEEGEVTVQVYADPETHRPERIEVRDTGVGIPQDRLDTIFEAFQQADTGTARRFGGTGLGLTIVGSLSELLGFRIEVESEPGVGSTFRVLLPADRVEPSEAEDPGDGASLDPPLHPSHSADRFAAGRPTGEMELDGRLVLVIDDDTDSRILLTHHLEETGARTIAASTGEQGIRMAREFRPDIITLDLQLPGVTGWEVLRALKSDPGLCDIPVVIVSIVAREDRGSVVGAADVIEKPINRDELIAALRRTLSEQPRRILIVDDTPDARDLLSSYLEDEGAEIRTASDGIEALRVLESYTPDVVLLDLLMPNMDGIAVIKKLNEREPYRSIPVIVVTAKDLTAEEEESLGTSALAVLRKGSRLEEGLREALQGIL